MFDFSGVTSNLHEILNVGLRSTKETFKVEASNLFTRMNEEEDFLRLRKLIYEKLSSAQLLSVKKALFYLKDNHEYADQET
jgi:hypothetical protein